MKPEEVHYRVHKIPPLVNILSQMKPVHNIPLYFSKIHCSIIIPHLCLGLQS